MELDGQDEQLRILTAERDAQAVEIHSIGPLLLAHLSEVNMMRW